MRVVGLSTVIRRLQVTRQRRKRGGAGVNPAGTTHALRVVDLSGLHAAVHGAAQILHARATARPSCLRCSSCRANSRTRCAKSARKSLATAWASITWPCPRRASGTRSTKPSCWRACGPSAGSWTPTMVTAAEAVAAATVAAAGGSDHIGDGSSDLPPAHQTI